MWTAAPTWNGGFNRTQIRARTGQRTHGVVAQAAHSIADAICGRSRQSRSDGCRGLIRCDHVHVRELPRDRRRENAAATTQIDHVAQRIDRNLSEVLQEQPGADVQARTGKHCAVSNDVEVELFQALGHRERDDDLGLSVPKP